MSRADTLFVENVNTIMKSNLDDYEMIVRPKWSDGTPAHTIKALHLVNTYDLSKDVIPIMTLRKQGIKNAIDEILWIYQKKSSDIRDLKSHIWDQWTVKKSETDIYTIGRAYGYQIGLHHRHHVYDGKEDLSRYPSATANQDIRDMKTWVYMDQLDAVRWDLMNNPSSRSIITTMYAPADLTYMGLKPCAFQMQYNVTIDAQGDMVLNAVLYQRSQDMLTANNWNVIQYAALINMLAREAGMKVGKFTHFIADAHIYDRHIPLVEEMCEAYHQFNLHDGDDIPHPNPTVWINPDVKSFYDYTVDDFKLEDYEYEEFNHKIEVAV